MLREAFNLGSKKLFELVVTNQQMSDDEWHKAKEEAEQAAQEGEEEAETAGETE